MERSASYSGRCHRDLRMASDGVAQRQRAMRDEFHHKPVGQRPDGVIVVLLIRTCLPCDRDGGALNRRRTLVATINVGSRHALRFGRRRNECGFVLATDVPRSICKRPSPSMLTKAPAWRISPGLKTSGRFAKASSASSSSPRRASTSSGSSSASSYFA